jgi:hypothetical protein
MKPWFVLATIFFTNTACNHGDGGNTRPRIPITTPRVAQDTPMLTISNSRARVLRSTHIALVRAIAVGTPQPSPNASMTHEVSVTFQLVHIFKGEFDVAEGQPFETHITQVNPAVEFTSAPAGVWSLQPVTVESRWVFFSESTDARTSVLARDPVCRAVVDANDVIADLELVHDIEQHHNTTRAALALASTRASQLHVYAMEYLWYRFETEALHDLSVFELYLGLLLAPALRTPTRLTLLNQLVQNTNRETDDGNPRRSRLAIAMFRLLSDPQISELHDNLVSPMLPSFLGLTSSHPPLSPREIFHEHPAERDVARAAVAGYHGTRDTTALRTWLWSESIP